MLYTEMVTAAAIHHGDYATLLEFDVAEHPVALQVDGVMIGRQAYHDPYFLATLEQHLDPAWNPPARHEVVARMIPYIERELARDERLGRITRHMLGLFAGQPGARAWRRYISENAFKDGAGSEVLVGALDKMPAAA